MNRLPALSLILATLVTPITALPQASSTPPAVPQPADPFPPADAKYFTATSPSVETVNAFLNTQWGYDPARKWRVMGIQATAAPNVAKVTIFLTDLTTTAATPSGAPSEARVQSFSFFTLPDGKHAITDGAGVIPFGATPFADTRRMLQERADGPAHGPANSDLLLVEFADMQCPHCRTAQGTMQQLAADFPRARIVYQSFPLTEIHPFAFQAAAYGICVQHVRNDAFFHFAQDVFDHQESLTPDRAVETLANAVTKAGLDPKAIAACSTTAQTKAAVEASTKLAQDAGVDQTPMLAVNGHLLPLTAIPYETLKKMVAFQAKLDAVK